MHALTLTSTHVLPPDVPLLLVPIDDNEPLVFVPY